MLVAAGHLYPGTGTGLVALLFGAAFMIFGITAFIRPHLFESVGWFPGRGGRFGEPLPPRDPADFNSVRPWNPLDPTRVPPGRVQARFYRAFGPVFAIAGLGVFIIGILILAS